MSYLNYALTGHKGLIGRALKRRLSEEGYICRLKVDLRDKKIPFDETNIIYLDKWKGNKIDVMFHLASFCKINK